jgi:virulence factor Mce-like protein
VTRKRDALPPVRRRRRRRLGVVPVGVLAMLAIVLATYIAFGGKLPWQDDHEIRAVVRSANELQSRSPVRIAGVEVGKVKKVERGPGSTAIVTMAIRENGLPIYEDAQLKIRPRLFLEGNFFVELQPGTPGARKLPEGGTIPLSQTANPVQLDQVLGTLRAGTRADLQRFLHGLAQGLDEGGGEALHRTVPFIEPAMLRAAVTAQALQGQRHGDLSGAIADGERTMGALASRRRDLPVLVRALNRTLTTLAERRRALGETVVGLDRLVGTAPAAFAEMNRLFPVARATVTEARPGIRAAPTTLRLALPVLDQAGRLIAPAELPALLDQLDPALRVVSSLEPPVRSLLAKLRPVTECVRLNALPTLKTPVVDPPLTTGQPPYRELLDGWVGLASGSQNFDGNGPAVRYHAGFGDNMITTGSVPSAGEPLVGLTSEPILGSRPRYTGVQPPFRPDVPCISQQPPDLTAETGPAPRQRRLP